MSELDCRMSSSFAAAGKAQGIRDGYPAPQNLSKLGGDGNAAAAFWIIKHGIKSTGMPAWGKSMADPYIWGMVAFLQQLPSLNTEQFNALVASSGGHLHGGGQSKMHNHEGLHEGQKGTAAGHHDADEAKEVAEVGNYHGEKNSAHAHEDAAAPTQDESNEHAHPQGAEASHDAPAAAQSNNSYPC